MGSEATFLAAARVAALASRVASVEACRRCAQRARTGEGFLVVVIGDESSSSFEQRTESGEAVAFVGRTVEYEHAPVVARRSDTGCSA